MTVTVNDQASLQQGGSSAIANTDALPEGSGNLYHTSQRVRGTALTGLSTATATPVTAADTVLVAAGKLQAQATDNAALLPSFFNTAWYKSGLYYDAVYPYYTTIADHRYGRCTVSQQAQDTRRRNF